jgi:hypothetical protein
VAVVIIMTRKNETMKKIEPYFGQVYEALKYEDVRLARFIPVWFMFKRYVFLAVVFNFTYTQGLILTYIHLNLVEMCLLSSYCPYHDTKNNKIAIFNMSFAYFFYIVL